MAGSLEDGVRWCEGALGICPGPGGEHPLMGTHNRLFKIATPNDPLAYFEIIALNPKGEKAPHRTGARWFDMDDTVLRKKIEQQGPQLIHWVARVDNATLALTQLNSQGIDRGELLAASRQTESGLLSWKITVRQDGQRLFDGCLPTLIEWGTAHPAQNMQDSGVALIELQISHPQDAALRLALTTLGNRRVKVEHGPAGLHARLQTPKGPVSINS